MCLVSMHILHTPHGDEELSQVTQEPSTRERGRETTQTFGGVCKSCLFSTLSMALDPERIKVYGEVLPSLTVVLSSRMTEVGSTSFKACGPLPLAALHHTLDLAGSEMWHTVAAGMKLS